MADHRSARALFRELTRTATSAHANGDRAAVAATGHGLARWQILDGFAAQPATVPWVARRLRQSRQSVQRIVDVLSADGLLDRLANPDHRSSPLFTVTASGRRLLDELDTSVDDWHEVVVARMSRAEIAELTALLVKLRDVADDYVGMPADPQ